MAVGATAAAIRAARRRPGRPMANTPPSLPSAGESDPLSDVSTQLPSNLWATPRSTRYCGESPGRRGCPTSDCCVRCVGRAAPRGEATGATASPSSRSPEWRPLSVRFADGVVATRMAAGRCVPGTHPRGPRSWGGPVPIAIGVPQCPVMAGSRPTLGPKARIQLPQPPVFCPLGVLSIRQFG